MKTPTPCTCGGRHVVSDTDAQRIRRVRRHSLELAERWKDDPESEPARECILWTAHCCLMRLRELRAQQQLLAKAHDLGAYSDFKCFEAAR
jgi:hypothetical protein